MATNIQRQNGLRGGVPEPVLPQAGEKFMGQAQEVPRPALANGAAGAPAPAAPTAAPAAQAPGRANMMGSGSAPIGQSGGAPAPSAAATRINGLAAGARGRINGGMGRAVGLGVAAQAIGDSAAEDSTERYARRFNVAEPTGDGSIADVAKFVGLRAGGFASDLGNNLTFGLAGKLFRDKQQDEAAAARGTPAAAAGAAPDAAIATPAVPAVVQNAAAPGGPLTGSSIRRVDTPGAAPLFTNDPADPAGRALGGNLSTGGGGQEQLAAMRRAGDLQAEISTMRAGLRDRGDTGAYLRGAGQVATMQPGGVSSELAGQIAKLAGAKNLTAAGVNALNGLVEAQNRPAMEAARLAENARQADQQADVSLRSQGVAARGQDMSARTAALNAQRDQANADRDFGLKTQDFGLRAGEAGAKRDVENFNQREAATKNLTARYDSMFTTTDKDGKQVVDKARSAKYALGVQQFVGTRQAELEQAVQSGKATAQEKAALEKLRTKGAAALDAEDLATIESQMKLGERAEQTSGLTGGSYVASSNPGDFQVVGRKQNLFGSDTLSLKGGGSIRENDAKFDEAGNAILPNVFKRKTNEFDLAKGIRQ